LLAASNVDALAFTATYLYTLRISLREDLADTLTATQLHLSMFGTFMI
jgi:hypothetical protein